MPILILLIVLMSGCAAPQYHCEQEGIGFPQMYCPNSNNLKSCYAVDSKWVPNGNYDCYPMKGD